MLVEDNMGGADVSDEEVDMNEEMMEDEAQSSKSDDSVVVVPNPDNADSVLHAKLKARILNQRASLKNRVHLMEEMRQKIQRYVPGQWLVEAGGMKAGDFEIPKITSLLLVGAMGAGKSTLINNLIRVVNNKTNDFDRAQVCGDPGENGTYFSNEYVLTESKSICIFDSRGFPEVKINEGLEVLESWMKGGVRHGQFALRSSEEHGKSKVKEDVLKKGRQAHYKSSIVRRINFVIVVINAEAVHKLRHSDTNLSRVNFVRIFKFPYVAFKDDRPVIVMTHGDMLSEDDRIKARIFLGNMLGVSPVDHIFDIAGFTGRVYEDDEQRAENDYLLLDMLEYALQRADRNLPYKKTVSDFLVQYKEIVVKGFNDLDPSKQMILSVLASCWVVLLGLLLAAYVSLS